MGSNPIERTINRIKDINAAGVILDAFDEGYDGPVYLKTDLGSEQINVNHTNWRAGTVEAQRSLSDPVEIFRASNVHIPRAGEYQPVTGFLYPNTPEKRPAPDRGVFSSMAKRLNRK